MATSKAGGKKAQKKTPGGKASAKKTPAEEAPVPQAEPPESDHAALLENTPLTLTAELGGTRITLTARSSHERNRDHPEGPAGRYRARGLVHPGARDPGDAGTSPAGVVG